MAPIDDQGSDGEDAEDVAWPCEMCQSVLLDPVTLPCCGQSHCQQCLRQWVVVSLRNSQVSRCPAAGCGQPLPSRLPAVSRVLQAALEALAPGQVRRRRAEYEAEKEQAEKLPGGFVPFQEVAASRDLFTDGMNMVVAFGAQGIVLEQASDCEERLRVRFDASLCDRTVFQVTAAEIVPQLDPKFGVHIGQRVVASQELRFGEVAGVAFGTQGTVLKAFNEERFVVQFDQRLDGAPHAVLVRPFEVQPWRQLLGGFTIAERVEAARDLMAGSTLIVCAGTGGIVRSQYSDTRIMVQFDHRQDGSSNFVNVTPGEIRRSRAAE